MLDMKYKNYLKYSMALICGITSAGVLAMSEMDPVTQSSEVPEVLSNLTIRSSSDEMDNVSSTPQWFYIGVGGFGVGAGVSFGGPYYNYNYPVYSGYYRMSYRSYRYYRPAYGPYWRGYYPTYRGYRYW